MELRNFPHHQNFIRWFSDRHLVTW